MICTGNDLNWQWFVLARSTCKARKAFRPSEVNPDGPQRCWSNPKLWKISFENNNLKYRHDLCLSLMESVRPPYFSRISGADSSSDQSELQVCLKPGSKRHVGIIDNRYMTTFQWYLTDVPQQTSYHNTTQHTSYQENSPKIRITCTHWSFSYRLDLGHWTGHPSPGGKHDRYIYILKAGNTGKMFNNNKNDQFIHLENISPGILHVGLSKHNPCTDRPNTFVTMFRLFMMLLLVIMVLLVIMILLVSK